MKTKKIIIVATLILSMLLMSMSAFAASPVTLADDADEITVTRKVQGVTNPVTVTYGYTIAYKGDGPNGGVTGNPTISNIVFNNAAPNASNEVSQTGTIDLSGVSFTEAGIYTWTITESSSSDPTTYPKAPTDADSYEFQVKVTYQDVNGVRTLVPEIVNQVKAEGATEKTDEIQFPIPSEFVYLTLTKTVTGDMGDQDHPFEFTVNVAGNTGDTYVVSGSRNGTTSISANTDTVLTAKHGDTITIGRTDAGLNQIIKNSNYTITESDTAAVPYTTTVDGTQSSTRVASKTATADGENPTTFVNDYTNSVDTGVFLNIAPFVVLIAVAIVGIVMIKKTSNKE